jgi:hypothetical protein
MFFAKKLSLNLKFALLIARDPLYIGRFLNIGASLARSRTSSCQASGTT